MIKIAGSESASRSTPKCHGSATLHKTVEIFYLAISPLPSSGDSSDILTTGTDSSLLWHNFFSSSPTAAQRISSPSGLLFPLLLLLSLTSGYRTLPSLVTRTRSSSLSCADWRTGELVRQHSWKFKQPPGPEMLVPPQEGPHSSISSRLFWLMASRRESWSQ